MIDIQNILEQDQAITLSLNGSDSITFDKIMISITETWTWMPVAVCLLYVIIKNSSWRIAFLSLISIALVITFSDQITSGFCKPYFHRFRPTQDPSIMYFVDVVNGYRGGKYGFMSSHAANTFSVFLLVALLIRNRALTVTAFAWAFLNAYSRIYLGVHYLGDVICGTIVGICVSLIVYFFYKKLLYGIQEKRIWNSSSYTSTGYLVTDIKFLLLVFYLTFFSIIILALY